MTVLLSFAAFVFIASFSTMYIIVRRDQAQKIKHALLLPAAQAAELKANHSIKEPVAFAFHTTLVACTTYMLAFILLEELHFMKVLWCQ